MNLSKIMSSALMCLIIVSCSKNNDDTDATIDKNGSDTTLSTKGNVTIHFDNVVGDQDFIVNTKFNKSNEETYQLKDLKYIVSNIRLKDENGKVFMYPKDKNIFIINEANGDKAGNISIILDNVDGGVYKQITFGIGIDQERYKLGAKGQGDFLVKAESEGMLWSWATGYKFTLINGQCSYGEKTDENLAIHIGSLGTTTDMYNEVTLDFPYTIKVADNREPKVHIYSDISKFFDGSKALNFSEGYNEVHTNAEKMGSMMENLKQIFYVGHVH